MRAGCASMAPDGLAAGYDHVADAYTAPTEGGGDAGGGSGGSSGPACALPQLGTDGKDTPATLVPSGSGDAIRGRGGDDRLRGLNGDDCLYGETGDDRLAGDAGADRLNARDGAVDRVKCGPGRDRVIADRRNELGRGC
jgi:Ca2+-binding RTX toxin-like protein